MTSQFLDMTSSSNVFDVVLFLLSSLVTCPSFMSILALVLEFWQFSFIRDWPEIRKSKIPPSEFCPISGEWDDLWIPNVSRMSLIEFYGMQQNSRVTAFTVFELLRENQLGGVVKLPPLPLSHNDQELVDRQQRRTVLYSAQKLLHPKYRNPTHLSGEEIPVKHTASIVWSP